MVTRYLDDDFCFFKIDNASKLTRMYGSLFCVFSLLLSVFVPFLVRSWPAGLLPSSHRYPSGYLRLLLGSAAAVVTFAFYFLLILYVVPLLPLLSRNTARTGIRSGRLRLVGKSWVSHSSWIVVVVVVVAIVVVGTHNLIRNNRSWWRCWNSCFIGKTVVTLLLFFLFHFLFPRFRRGVVSSWSSSFFTTNEEDGTTVAGSVFYSIDFSHLLLLFTMLAWSSLSANQYQSLDRQIGIGIVVFGSTVTNAGTQIAAATTNRIENRGCWW